MNMTPSARFFESRSEFSASVLAMIERAETELLIFDPTYVDWPGGSHDLAQALEAFLRRGPRPRLRMIVDRLDRVTADYPRIASLLTTYQHLAQCRPLPERYANLSETIVVADAASVLRRPAATAYRGVSRVLDIDYASSLRARFLELWDACNDPYSPTTLGL